MKIIKRVKYLGGCELYQESKTKRMYCYNNKGKVVRVKFSLLPKRFILETKSGIRRGN